MSRYRPFYSCGHKGPVLDGDQLARVTGRTARVYCEKCAGDVVVIGSKRLKDSAKLPNQRSGR